MFDPSSSSSSSPPPSTTMVFRRVDSPTSYRPRQRVTTGFASPSLQDANSNDGDNADGCGNSTSPHSPIARRLASERRTCKSHNGEIVWPPRIEAALVQALEAHLPTALDNSNSQKANLFPDRNKFCAHWIRERTGIERTPRQVGSRIQMLRGKWRGTPNFKLVALPRELESWPSSPTSPAETAAPPIAENNNHAPPPPTAAPAPPSPPPFDDPFPTYNAPISEPEMMCWTGVRPTHSSSPPPPLPPPSPPPTSAAITPSPQYYQLLVELPVHLTSAGFCTTTNFTSAIPLCEWSLSKIFFDDVYQCAEWTRIEEMGAGSYVTELVPKYWGRLLADERDIRRYKVLQEIFPADPSSPFHPSSPTSPSSPTTTTPTTPTYVMVYRFEHPHDPFTHQVVDNSEMALPPPMHATALLGQHQFHPESMKGQQQQQGYEYGGFDWSNHRSTAQHQHQQQPHGFL